MELILENFKSQNPVAGRIEALKTLTKLLLYEVESLAEISPAKTNQPPNETISQFKRPSSALRNRFDLQGACFGKRKPKPFQPKTKPFQPTNKTQYFVEAFLISIV